MYQIMVNTPQKSDKILQGNKSSKKKLLLSPGTKILPSNDHTKSRTISTTSPSKAKGYTKLLQLTPVSKPLDAGYGNLKIPDVGSLSKKTRVKKEKSVKAQHSSSFSDIKVAPKSVTKRELEEQLGNIELTTPCNSEIIIEAPSPINSELVSTYIESDSYTNLVSRKHKTREHMLNKECNNSSKNADEDLPMMTKSTDKATREKEPRVFDKNKFVSALKKIQVNPLKGRVSTTEKHGQGADNLPTVTLIVDPKLMDTNSSQELIPKNNAPEPLEFEADIEASKDDGKSTTSHKKHKKEKKKKQRHRSGDLENTCDIPHKKRKSIDLQHDEKLSTSNCSSNQELKVQLTNVLQNSQSSLEFSDKPGKNVNSCEKTDIPMDDCVVTKHTEKLDRCAKTQNLPLTRDNTSTRHPIGLNSSGKISSGEVKGLKRTARKTVKKNKPDATELAMVKNFTDSLKQSEGVTSKKPTKTVGVAPALSGTSQISKPSTTVIDLANDDDIEHTSLLVDVKKKHTESVSVTAATTVAVTTTVSTILSYTKGLSTAVGTTSTPSSNLPATKATAAALVDGRANISSREASVSCQSTDCSEKKNKALGRDKSTLSNDGLTVQSLPPASNTPTTSLATTPSSTPTVSHKSDVLSTSSAKNPQLKVQAQMIPGVNRANTKPMDTTEKSAFESADLDNILLAAGYIENEAPTNLSLPSKKTKQPLEEAKLKANDVTRCNETSAALKSKREIAQVTTGGPVNTATEIKRLRQESQGSESDLSQSQPPLVIDTQAQSPDTDLNSPLFSPDVYVAPPSVQVEGPIIEAPPSVAPAANVETVDDSISGAGVPTSDPATKSDEINIDDENYLPNSADNRVGLYKFNNGCKVVTVYRDGQLYCCAHQIVLRLKMSLANLTQVKCTAEEAFLIRLMDKGLKENFDSKVVPLSEVKSIFYASNTPHRHNASSLPGQLSNTERTRNLSGSPARVVDSKKMTKSDIPVSTASVNLAASMPQVSTATSRIATDRQHTAYKILPTDSGLRMIVPSSSHFPSRLNMKTAETNVVNTDFCSAKPFTPTPVSKPQTVTHMDVLQSPSTEAPIHVLTRPIADHSRTRHASGNTASANKDQAGPTTSTGFSYRKERVLPAQVAVATQNLQQLSNRETTVAVPTFIGEKRLECHEIEEERCADYGEMERKLQSILLDSPINVQHVKKLPHSNPVYTGKLVPKGTKYAACSPFIVLCDRCDQAFSPLSFMLHLEPADKKGTVPPRSTLWGESIKLLGEVPSISTRDFWNAFVDWFQMFVNYTFVNGMTANASVVAQRKSSTENSSNRTSDAIQSSKSASTNYAANLDLIPASPAPFRRTESPEIQEVPQTSTAQQKEQPQARCRTLENLAQSANAHTIQHQPLGRRSSAHQLSPQSLSARQPTSQQQQIFQGQQQYIQQHPQQTQVMVQQQQVMVQQQQQPQQQPLAQQQQHVAVQQHQYAAGIQSQAIAQQQTLARRNSNSPLSRSYSQTQHMSTLPSQMVAQHSSVASYMGGYRMRQPQQQLIQQQRAAASHHQAASQMMFGANNRQQAAMLMQPPSTAPQQGQATTSSPGAVPSSLATTAFAEALGKQRASMLSVEAAFSLLEDENKSLRAQLTAERREKQDYALKLQKALADSQTKDQQILAYKQKLAQLGLLMGNR